MFRFEFGVPRSRGLAKGPASADVPAVATGGDLPAAATGRWRVVLAAVVYAQQPLIERPWKHELLCAAYHVFHSPHAGLPSTPPVGKV